MPDVLALVDHDSIAFQAGRPSVNLVCVGDSITGWNNYGDVEDWPHPTFPRFLQERCEPLGLSIANAGIAGEVSANGEPIVRQCLALFPNAKTFVIGFGTNDLGMWPDVDRTSPMIIENLDRIVWALRDAGRRPILLNIPPANGSMFSRSVAEELTRSRAVHNGRLATYCEDEGIPLVNLSSLLDSHFADELHPNEAGARLIAEQVFEVLNERAESAPEA